MKRLFFKIMMHIAYFTFSIALKFADEDVVDDFTKDNES